MAIFSQCSPPSVGMWYLSIAERGCVCMCVCVYVGKGGGGFSNPRIPHIESCKFGALWSESSSYHMQSENNNLLCMHCTKLMVMLFLCSSYKVKFADAPCIQSFLPFIYLFLNNACLAVVCVWSNERRVWRQRLRSAEISLWKWHLKNWPADISLPPVRLERFLFFSVLSLSVHSWCRAPLFERNSQYPPPPHHRMGNFLPPFGSAPGHMISTLEPAGRCLCCHLWLDSECHIGDISICSADN